MDKNAKIRVIIISAIILFLGLSFVYGFQITASFFNKDISKIKLEKQKNLTVNDFGPMLVYDYTEESSKSSFKVQITEFNDSGKLDSLIENKVKKSSGNKTLNGNIFFVDQYKNYLFWRTADDKFVQIISIRYKNISKQSIIDNFKTEGSGIFSESLIEQYVLQYPSICNDEGCLSRKGEVDKKVKEDLRWFDSPPVDVKSSDYYFDSMGICPTNESEFETLKEKKYLDDTGLENIKDQCKNNKEYTLSSKKVPKELSECGKEIDSYLKLNNILVYNELETLDECSLRISFLEEHKEYNPEEMQFFTEKRDKFILDRVKLLEEIKIEFGESPTKRIVYRNGTISKEDTIAPNKSSIKHWFEEND